MTRKYEVVITGDTPLLPHADNIQWQERVKKWQKDPANRELSVPGDDRSPAFTWIGCLTMEGGRVVISADNLMTVLREGGAKCPTGKGQKTFKAQTQSGLVVDQSSWAILVNGKEIPSAPIMALVNEPDFMTHERAVEDMGFTLFIKRSRISPTAKHVRVRPRFDQWELRGTITVLDDQITEEILRDILTFAGKYSGLCDWRPSAPKSPGSFGKFGVTLTKV